MSIRYQYKVTAHRTKTKITLKLETSVFINHVSAKNHNRIYFPLYESIIHRPEMVPSFHSLHNIPVLPPDPELMELLKEEGKGRGVADNCGADIQMVHMTQKP